MSKSAKLTVAKLRALEPRDKPYEVRDEAGGLGTYVVVWPSGQLSYIMRYRQAGTSKAVKPTLGKLSLDEHGLASMRAAARTMRNEIEAARRGAGQDPAEKKKAQRRAEIAAAEAAHVAEIEAAQNTVEAVCARYMASVGPKLRPKTRSERQRQIKRELAPWAKLNIADIKKRDVTRLLDKVAARAPVMANRILATLQHLFAFCVERDIIAVNPTTGVRMPVKEYARERVLDDSEIAIVWKAAGRLGFPYGSCIRMALLTGARRSELAGLRHAEISADGATWSLPATRAKNKRSAELPLSSQAQALLQSLPRFADNPFVFGSNLVSFPRTKLRLDKAIREINGGEPLKGGDFVFHDLRRSVATAWQRLGVRLEVVERLLCHQGGSRSGIAGVYQRHDFKDDMREAAQRLGDHIEKITGEPAPAESNVVAIGKAKRA